jgi:hypothetical protein
VTGSANDDADPVHASAAIYSEAAGRSAVSDVHRHAAFISKRKQGEKTSPFSCVLFDMIAARPVAGADLLKFWNQSKI